MSLSLLEILDGAEYRASFIHEESTKEKILMDFVFSRAESLKQNPLVLQVSLQSTQLSVFVLTVV